MKIWAHGIVNLLLVVSSLAAPTKDGGVYNVNGRIPLGLESLRARPAGVPFYLMASAENSAFRGMYRAEDPNGREVLLKANKTEVKFYPEHVEFRVTASTREKLFEDPPFDIDEKIGVHELFTHVRFRLKVFRGLDYRYIQPRLVTEIGVPESIDYSERIYRVGFDLGKIPIEDRVVMEVIQPDGNRLCKFHLDLY